MKIGVVGNINKELLPKAIEMLLGIEAAYNLHIFFHVDLKEYFQQMKLSGLENHPFLSSAELALQSDIIIAIGGDGTILNAARIVGDKKIPLLGINLGKLGFLAEASLDELEMYITEIISKNHLVEDRTVMKAVLEDDHEYLYALNEIVIDKSSSTRVIRISVYVNDDYLVSFPGDGLIISTPTGSTGYALAAGGPIVVPASKVFVIQPISAHSLNARTIVVPDSCDLKIVVEKQSDEARVTADGQQQKNFIPPKHVIIQRGNYPIRLIKRKNRTYYDVLRAKLLLGSDIRSGEGKKR